MSFFKKLSKLLETEVQSKPVVAAPAPVVEEEETVETPAKPGVVPMERNDKDDFKLLLSLYRTHKGDGDGSPNMVAMVKEVNPNADPHTCPYCGVVHEFKAARARKCPACSNKMVVRQELFITEDQAKELEGRMNSFYLKQGALYRVGNLLEGAQQSKLDKEQARYLNELAEAFRYMAQVENQKGAGGYDFWDKAWGYYNHSRSVEMRNQRKDMLQYSRLPDTMWDMTQMLIDQADNTKTPSSAERTRRQALHYACMTLAEAAKFGADPYFVTTLYGLVKKEGAKLNVSPDEFKGISSDVATRMRLAGPALKKYETWLRELSEFEVIAY
jgi:hypothetical protein